MDARQRRRRQLVELGRAGRVGQHKGDVPAFQPVLQVGAGEQCRGRDDNHTQLDGGQHRLPERHLVAQHEQYAVALFRAEPHQKVCHLAGATGELGIGERSLGAGLLEDAQGRRVIVAGNAVEVV